MTLVSSLTTDDALVLTSRTPNPNMFIVERQSRHDYTWRRTGACYNTDTRRYTLDSDMSTHGTLTDAAQHYANS